MHSNANPYLALGVKPFINCCAVRTVQGGSLMLPQVREAMALASRQFVNLDELMEAAGARIAELTGAEWGIVTCGSAAAVALGTAACVAGNDPARMLRLPFTEGMPNRVIMPRNQRFAYDQAIRMIGTTIVEIDDRAGLDAALDGNVAMVCLLGTHEHLSAIRLEEIAAVVGPRGIPILVDAASEHLERPSPWLARGADLVVYSGGKFLRGPQTSGLLLGRKVLVQAAWRNASPHQAIGRPMKVSKEDVIGLLAAVEYWFNDRDQEAERRRWRDDLATIAEALGGIAQTETIEPRGVERVPRLLVRWDAGRVGLDGAALRERLMEGEPRVVLDDMSATADSIEVDPFALQPGEAASVGAALAAALSEGAAEAETAAPGLTPDLAGDWELRVRFLHGERTHRLKIGQAGTALTGQHQSDAFSGPVALQLTPSGIAFGFDLRYEGTSIAYRFMGRVSDGEMAGTVELGSSTDHHQGVVNLAQFGTGEWQARRLGQR
jgi:D-glucosaminate-6-phosphate ammonia-lyase